MKTNGDESAARARPKPRFRVCMDGWEPRYFRTFTGAEDWYSRMVVRGLIGSIEERPLSDDQIEVAGPWHRRAPNRDRRAGGDTMRIELTIEPKFEDAWEGEWVVSSTSINGITYDECVDFTAATELAERLVASALEETYVGVADLYR